MYKRAGWYGGKVPLQKLAERAASFDVAWSPSRYGTTVEHLALIRDAYQDEFGPYIPGKWAYTMLVLIKPEGGAVPIHRDVPQKAGLLRHHVVLQNNEHCWSYHDGDWQRLDLGGVYTVDETRDHASINWGKTERIHLVVDVEKEGVTAK